MLIKDIDMMCIKVEPKQNSKGEDYLIITLADMQTGDTFNLIEKDMSYLSSIQMFKQYKLDLNLSSTKYGLTLKMENIR